MNRMRSDAFETDEFVQALLHSAHQEQPGVDGYERTARALGISSLSLSTLALPELAGAKLGAASEATQVGVTTANTLTSGPTISIGAKLLSTGLASGSLTAVFFKSLIGTFVVSGLVLGGVEAAHRFSEPVQAPQQQPSPLPDQPSTGVQVRSGTRSPTSEAPATLDTSRAVAGSTRTSTAKHRATQLAPPAVTTAVPGPVAQELAEEVAILARARQALAEGAPERALSIVAQHARRFPSGNLALERDVLRVRALAAAGRRAESQHHARQFVERHPQNPHAETLRRDLRDTQ